MEFKELLSYILPSEFYTYFELRDVKEKSGHLHIYLDENKDLPPFLEGKDIVSNGFAPSKKVQDFPIRDRAVFLHVRRRKWLERPSGKVYMKKWDLNAEGTSYTKEFASFLKELVG